MKGIVLPFERRVNKAEVPEVPAGMRLQARERLAELVTLAEKIYGRSFRTPSISFDLRGVVAGIAYESRHHVQLNAQLFMENEQAYYLSVIPHEWAHLVTGILHPLKKVHAHGEEWQSVMRSLGANPERYHQLDTARSTVHKQYVYFCKCKEYVFSAIRHKYAQTGRSDYQCRKCKMTLTLLSERKREPNPEAEQ